MKIFSIISYIANVVASYVYVLMIYVAKKEFCDSKEIILSKKVCFHLLR